MPTLKELIENPDKCLAELQDNAMAAWVRKKYKYIHQECFRKEAARWCEEMENKAMEETIELIKKELEAAMTKFPEWPNDPIHAAAIIGEEFGELQQALIQCLYEPGKATYADVRKEAIQVAAMTVRFAMSLDKYNLSEAQSQMHNQ